MISINKFPCCNLERCHQKKKEFIKLRTQLKKLISQKDELLVKRVEMAKEEEQRHNQLVNNDISSLYTTPSTGSMLKRDRDDISVLTDPVPKIVLKKSEIK